MTAPGTWQHVITTAGHHLRLIGANGEPVLTSEVYADPRSVLDALRLVRRTGAAGSRHRLPEVVDTRPAVLLGVARTPDPLRTRVEVMWDTAAAQEDLVLAETGEALPHQDLICPECLTGKHENCNAQAWDPATDAPAPCDCPYTTHGARPAIAPGTPGGPPFIARGAGHASQTPEGGQA